MKILPSSTRPPTHKIRRRHSPAPTRGRYGYQSYRACLRWEFGFSCALCLLHEADLARQGVEGLGVTGIEHYHSVSTTPELINSYNNCLYACRLCNDSRANAPVSIRTRRLLNPCDDNWSAHFEVKGDLLQPQNGDLDAEYTHRVYDLDDPRKIRMRQMRRETVNECKALIKGAYRLAEALLDRSFSEHDPLSLGAAEELLRCIDLAVKDLATYRAIPADAPQTCRCHNEENHTLPSWLEAQVNE